MELAETTKSMCGLKDASVCGPAGWDALKLQLKIYQREQNQFLYLIHKLNQTVVMKSVYESFLGLVSSKYSGMLLLHDDRIAKGKI